MTTKIKATMMTTKRQQTTTTAPAAAWRVNLHPHDARSRSSASTANSPQSGWLASSHRFRSFRRPSRKQKGPKPHPRYRRSGGRTQHNRNGSKRYESNRIESKGTEAKQNETPTQPNRETPTHPIQLPTSKLIQLPHTHRQPVNNRLRKRLHTRLHHLRSVLFRRFRTCRLCGFQCRLRVRLRVWLALRIRWRL